MGREIELQAENWKKWREKKVHGGSFMTSIWIYIVINDIRFKGDDNKKKCSLNYVINKDHGAF